MLLLLLLLVVVCLFVRLLGCSFVCLFAVAVDVDVDVDGDGDVDVAVAASAAAAVDVAVAVTLYYNAAIFIFPHTLPSLFWNGNHCCSCWLLLSKMPITW